MPQLLEILFSLSMTIGKVTHCRGISRGILQWAPNDQNQHFKEFTKEEVYIYIYIYTCI